jgi:hypothetical protein
MVCGGDGGPPAAIPMSPHPRHVGQQAVDGRASHIRPKWVTSPVVLADRDVRRMGRAPHT